MAMVSDFGAVDKKQEGQGLKTRWATGRCRWASPIEFKHGILRVRTRTARSAVLIDPRSCATLHAQPLATFPRHLMSFILVLMPCDAWSLRA